MQQAFATIEQTYHNPGGRVLRVVAGLACNVPDETIYQNVATNAAFSPRNWLKQLPEHDGIALLCGSGPSLADTVPLIREAQAKGAHVFALNGAAEFLWRQHKIMPDFQVLMDARPETAALIGPAKQLLLASQVDPMCFKRRPYATLWHSTHGEWIPEFPDHPEDYSVIAGSVTVGNTALALTYALGYRDLRCFGYDSSHRNTNGHAFAQALNDGDALVVTPFRGVDYVSSYAMRLQSEVFIDRARLLEREGCKVSVEGSGLLPEKWRALHETMTEREKYQAVWECREYRTYSPGEEAVPAFLLLESARGSLLDIGCGTGRAGIALERAGFAPIQVDFTANARDPGIFLPFLCRDIAAEQLPKAPFGYCTDVMEHLPPEQVDGTLRNILAACDKVFFTICTAPDELGCLIGHQLHLTVRPFEWWRDKLADMAEITFAEHVGVTATFYVTAKR